MGKIHVLKRADAIIRWLERLKQSYAKGDAGTAYIEAECARADIEALTHDVIAGITLRPKRPMMSYVTGMLKVIALSIAVLLTWTSPLVREEYPLPGMAQEVVAIVDEPHNPPVTVMQEEVRPTRRKASKPTTKPQPMPKASKPATNPLQPTPSKPAKAPAYDKLAYLTLTGQKALNNDNTTIKLTGRGTK